MSLFREPLNTDPRHVLQNERQAPDDKDWVHIPHDERNGPTGVSMCLNTSTSAISLADYLTIMLFAMPICLAGIIWYDYAYQRSTLERDVSVRCRTIMQTNKGHLLHPGLVFFFIFACN